MSDTQSEPNPAIARRMKYKGFRVAVHPPEVTDGAPSKATFTIRDDAAALVHEGVVHGRFEHPIDAEDAGYDAARQDRREIPG